ncbi:7-cyano-7-deazaguanine synthase [Gracilimonas sp.]|uniref:7-cyano-7-deazaguanine synthase n=1 Tax=Gracilimonas sp. TaxID=1974203 RepID=UPI0032ED3577
MNSKAIILFSGGLDSTIALAWALERYGEVICLSYLFPERPKKEILAAQKICHAYGVKLLEIELPFIKSFRQIKYGDGNVYGSSDSYIPMRNLIFYSIAAHYADILHAKKIIGGHLKSDSKVHADASYNFFRILENACRVSFSTSFLKEERIKSEVEIIMPLIHMSDQEAVELGIKVNAPIDKSWSCWIDRNDPCNECISCLDRKRALEEFQQK